MASYLNYITVQFWPEIKLLQDILQPLFFMLVNKHPFFLLTAGVKTPDREPYLAHDPLDQRGLWAFRPPES